MTFREALPRAVPLLLASAAIAGCSDGGESASTGADAGGPPPSKPRPAELSFAQANAVPLEITERQLLLRVGRPASIVAEGKGGRQRCLLYDQARAPAGHRWQFCFERGRLVVIASRYD